jgi:hypothetical protein
MALSKTARLAQEAKARRLIEDLKRCGDHPPVENPFLYTIEEVAQLLRLSPLRVNALCTEHKLGYVVRKWRHGVYVRRQRLVPRLDLLRYMQDHLGYQPARPQAKTSRAPDWARGTRRVS